MHADLYHIPERAGQIHLLNSIINNSQDSDQKIKALNLRF